MHSQKKLACEEIWPSFGLQNWIILCDEIQIDIKFQTLSVLKKFTSNGINKKKKNWENVGYSILSHWINFILSFWYGCFIFLLFMSVVSNTLKLNDSFKKSTRLPKFPLTGTWTHSSNESLDLDWVLR